MKAATLGIGGLLFLDFISIHAAREGGDPQDRDRRCSVRISIHAAREGGDQHDLLSFLITFYFNPRRP